MRLPLPSDALADRAAWQPSARDLLLDAASVTTNTALGAPPPTSHSHTQVLLDGALTASVQSFGGVIQLWIANRELEICSRL
jgi:hypothetical protein